METPNTVKNTEDTRKEYKVLKNWDVTNTTLPYYGSHQEGDTVLVHEDVAEALVSDGTLELVETAAIPASDPVLDGEDAPAREENEEGIA